MKTLSLLFLSAFLFGMPLLLHTQNSDLVFDHIGVDDGLSQNSVRCLMQDHKGFMWFGTEEGLNRYDGYEFEVYQNQALDPSSISANDIRSILEDQDGDIWVGTTQGLNMFSREENKFQRFSLDTLTTNLARRNFIYYLYESQDGIIWVGTEDGLLAFDKETRQIQIFRAEGDNGLTSNLIRCIYEDQDSLIWIGTANGLSCLNRSSQRFINYWADPTQEDALHAQSISCIQEDRQGNLWFGTFLGLYKFDRENQGFSSFFVPPEDNRSKNMIRCIEEDDQGMLWVGTFEGLRLFDPVQEQFLAYYMYEKENPNGLSANFIRSIAKDHRGDIWMGTIMGGVTVYHQNNHAFGTRFPGFQTQELSGKVISFFAEDARENIWIGTEDGGLNYLDRTSNTLTTYLHDPADPKSLSVNDIKHICIDRQGHVWIATFFGGLNRFDPASQIFYRYQQDPNKPGAFSDDLVNTLLQDTKGRIWIGTQDRGLNLYNADTDGFTEFLSDPNDPTTLSGNIIKCLLEGNHGQIWVGTRHSGLNRFDPETGFVNRYRHLPEDPKSISSDAITILFEDSKKTLWVGTEDAGLNRYDDVSRTFTSYRKSDGLPSDAIHGILEDGTGKLWLSTNKGLSHFDPISGTFTNYDQDNGLPSNQFSLGASLKTRSGEMLFGSINGYTIFKPADIAQNTFKPPVVISDFQLQNKAVPIGGENSPLEKHISEMETITLANNQSVFSFGFVALNYVRSGKNQYAYMMEGLDNEWNYVGDKRTADFTTLPHGEYVFRVKAANNSGVWNETGTSIQILILPPWYKTWWAYTLYSILFLLLLFAFRQYALMRAEEKHKLKLERMEREKVEEMSRMKLRFFTHLAHEFRTPLTLILAPVETLLQLAKGNAQMNRYLSTMQINSKYLLKLINELMDFRKLESGRMELNKQKQDIVSLVSGVSAAFQDIAQQHDISLHVKSELAELNTAFDLDKMQKVLYNLLSNAIKFTPRDGRGKIKVRLSLKNRKESGDWIRIQVKDNGPGIREAEMPHIFYPFFQGKEQLFRKGSSSGIGLALTKNLVELHGGEVYVESQWGKGATFTVEIPHVSLDEAVWVPPSTEEGRSSSEMATPAVALPGFLDCTEACHEKAAQLPDGQRPKILIVEDNPELRHYLADSLREMYCVLEAENGLIGWKTGLEHLPDLIISDIVMPEMDGMELCDKLKNDWRTSHLPVILLTARAGIEHRVEGLQTGADAYIAKPFHSHHLEAQIENLLASRNRLRNLYAKGTFPAPHESSNNPLDQKFLEQAERIVRDNLSNTDFTIELFAMEIGMSRSYFHRKLKALTGQSASEFVISIRLKSSISLLQRQELNVSEIAYEVGFNSPNYFNRCFRKHFGKSPSVYRSESLGNATQVS